MDYSEKVAISKKVKNANMIIICIIASISVLGLVMAVYSILRLKFLFMLIYLFAVALGLSYVIMRINTVLPTYISRSSGYLYMQNWVNGLFPFRIDKGFIGEFIPEKTIIKKIDISAITRIYLGSRNYLLKLVPEGVFNQKLNISKKKYENIIKRMEFIYILTKDNTEIYMSVTDYDDVELANLLKPIVDGNERIDFRSNNRIISKAIPPKKITL